MEILDHHRQHELCKTRPLYREGRKLTAVKTYTAASESVYLLIYGVPKLNLRNELKNLCQKYGHVSSMSVCDQYITEDFTECFKVKFQRIQSSRIAKRMIDTTNFYGGSLHVCYAPECETVDELRDKIKQRRLDVLGRMKRNELEKQKNANLQENNTITSNEHLNLTQDEMINMHYYASEQNSNSESSLLSRMFQINNSEHNADTTLNSSLTQSPNYYPSPYPHFPTNSSSNYEPFSINSPNNPHSSIISEFDGNTATCGRRDNDNLNLEQTDTMCTMNNKMADSIKSDVRKNKKELEYVFKRKRSKKDKELKSKIEMLEHVLHDKTVIGPQYDVTDLLKTQTNSGRIVVCGMDDKINKDRIFSNPKKNVNKITINIKKE